jgi:hypothetical protein
MAIYWNTLSNRHQEKLKRLATRQGITYDMAIRRIVSYIQNDNLYLARPDYFNALISDKDVERLLYIMDNPSSNNRNRILML